MPEPKPGESKDEYVGRCVKTVMGEGVTQEQALGKCYGMWDNHSTSKTVEKAIESVEAVLKKMEKDELFKMYEPEIKEMYSRVEKDINNISEYGKLFIIDIYLRSRQDGNEVEKSLELAKSFYQKEYKKLERFNVLKSLEAVLANIKTRLVG